MKDLENKWLSYLLKLDENRFFSIYRHYLGDFSHPYNKNQLAQKLIHFLKQESVNANLRHSLSHEEGRLLTILWTYRPVEEEKIRELWTGRRIITNKDPHPTLTRLEKRLLAFPYRENYTEYWLPSPAIDPERWARELNPLQLCRGRICPPTLPQPPYDELPLVVMLLTIVEYPLQDEVFLKKKFKKLLPGQQHRGFDIHDLEDLQLLETEEDEEEEKLYKVDWLEWDYLSQKTPLERALFLMTFMTDCMENLVRDTAPLFDRLPRDRCFTIEELQHVFAWVADNVGEYLEWANLLIDWVQKHQGAEPYSLASFPSSQSAARLVVNPNHELVAEHVDLELGLWLARCSRLVRCENILVTRLDQVAFQDYLERGGQLQKLVKALERFSGTPLPQNIAFTLAQWEEQHRLVQLQRGVFVQIKEPLLSVFRGHQPELIEGVHDLGDGRFFFSEKAWEQFRARTKKAPWNRVPRIEDTSKKQSYWSLFHQEKLVHIPPKILLSLPPADTTEESSQAGGDAPALEREIEDFLRDKPPGLQLETFRKFARQGYLLDPSQFEYVWSQLSPREVSGLNLQGKYNLIVDALEKGNQILFCDYADDRNEKLTYQVKPLSLLKSKRDPVLHAQNLQTNAKIELQVSRILKLVAIKDDI